MANDLPPSYTRPPPLVNSPTSLPSYTPLTAHSTPVPASPAAATLVEHVYSLDTQKGPWASLHVTGSSASGPGQIPQFWEKNLIAGRVDLIIEEQSFQSITLSLKGRLVDGARPSDALVFYEETKILWNKTMGDPREPGTKYNGRCKGDYTWPYTFTLPNEVVVAIPGIDRPQTHRLPQSFSERHTRASVEYTLTLRMVRGFLRGDTVLSTPFNYMPVTRPSPPSVLRSLAYQEKKPVPGLKADKDGWETMRQITLRGQTSTKQWAEAGVTLSLAKPLCYTRGTVIPLILSVESKDHTVLEMLSEPRAIVVRLRRRVLHAGDTPPSTPSAAAQSTKNTLLNIETALWWPSSDPHSRSSKLLNGEIHLPKELTPSACIGQFSIEYSVVISTFDTPSFTTSNSDPMLEVPVRIATMLAPGSRPQAYSPVNYSVGGSNPTSTFRVPIVFIP